MATIEVHNLNGEKVGTFELAEEVFGAVNEDLLWEAVKHYRASLRAGTASTKTRGLVSGAGRKLWKQKGTGRARIASIRSPLQRHGGTVHGPKPRSYDYAFPRKKLLGALRSALAAKLQDGKLFVVDSLEPKEAKSKSFRAALNKLNAKGTTLLVSKYIGETEKNLHLSSRNLKGVELIASNVVHPYHLLRYSSAVFSRPALEKLQESLKSTAPKRKAEVA
jgi:large subunit ribosomal protein L4